MSGQMTPVQVAALAARERSFDVTLGGVPGLVLRVLPTGVKTFRYRYQTASKRKWVALGNFPTMTVAEARREARRLQGQVAAGKDPARERKEARAERRATGTVADLVEAYLELYAMPRKRTAHEDARQLRRELVRRYGDLPVNELTKSHILTVLDEARRRGVRGGLNTLLAIIRKALNWAVGMDIIATNPAAGIQRPAPPNPRDRVLTRDELGAYWAALPTCAIDDRTRTALQIQALTGLRISEVTGARVVEVQLRERKFVIGADRMKSKLTHTVPLTAQLHELFEEALALAPTGAVHLFHNEVSGGPLLGQSVVRALNRHQPHFGFAEPFTSHDIRRTMATTLIEVGTEPGLIDRLHGRAPLGVLATHYNHYGYLPEKLAALETWGGIVIEAARRIEVAR